MADLLIRGLSAAAVARIDAAAAARGLSRNEFLRRRFDDESDTARVVAVTVADLERAADAASDLLDPEVMGSAWQ